MRTHRDLLIDQILGAENSILHAAQNPAGVSWLELNLTMAQLKALFALDQNGALAVGNLAELLNIGLSAASLLVERLVRLALVERREDPADRRRTVVRLSTEGEKLITQVRYGSQQLFRELCAQLDSADLKALARGVTALAQVAFAHNQVRGTRKLKRPPSLAKSVREAATSPMPINSALNERSRK